MGKTLAGGCGEINLQQIRTQQPGEKGLGFEAKELNAGELRGEEERRKCTELYFPLRGEINICHVIGVSQM